MSSLDVTGAASARTNRVWAIRVILALGLAVTCMLGAVTSAAASDAPTTRAGLQLVVPGGATHMAARGNVVATTSADGSSVSIIDAAALTVRSTTALPVAPSGVALSPDGSFAYVTAGYEVFVVDTATGAVVRSGAYNNEPMRDLVLGGTSPCNLTSRNGMQSRSPAMSPDGRLLYFVGDCHYGWPVIFSIDHGLSTSDFTPALEQFLGTGAGLTPSVITRLTTQWQGEAKAFNERPLHDSDYVYV